MLSLDLRTLVSLALGVTILAVLSRAVFTPLRRIPGPWHASFTNLVLKFHVLKGERSQYIHSLHRRYGPFVRISPTELAIADLASFKQIHRVGSSFRKADWYLKFSMAGEHAGIFAMTDAKQHAARRRLFAQPFANSSILGYEDVVREKVATAVGKIKRDASRREGAADVLKWWTFMATDVSGELSFGTSFNMLESEMKNEYITNLETTMMLSGIRVELSTLMTVASYLPIPSLQNMMSLRKRLDVYGAQAMNNLRRYTIQYPERSDRTLFGKFFTSREKQQLSDAQLAAEASNLIVAGSDTTAVTLTYWVWAILHPKNASVKQAVMKEIEAVPVDAPYTSINALETLKNSITEALRLYGAAPGSLPRVVPRGGATLGDYEVPADTIVSTQAFTLHRDPTIFLDPEEFRPERWEEPTAAMKDAYSPFGAGARTCIGVHLAWMELQMAAFVFLKEMPSVRLRDVAVAEKDMEFENYFLIAPKGHKCEVVG